jgi:hypothetical protein
MSRISIRSYKTDGPTYIVAEIVWNPADPVVEPVRVDQNLPTGELASLAVIPSNAIDGYITVTIYPNDVPEVDVFSLPINLTGPIPERLLGAELPSLYFTSPFQVTALADTELGFRVSAGAPPF